MKTKSLFYFILTALLIALYSAGCSGQTDEVALPETTPDQVVQEFYDWYLADRAAGPKDIHDSPQISADLLARYDEAMQSQVPGNIISFVCAQDFPESVVVGVTDVQGDVATVAVQTSFGTTIELTLSPIDGTWQINDVTCK